MKIGVLALQGAFIEHEQFLKKLGADTIEIRTISDLDGIDGLVLPGGESTVQGRLLRSTGLLEPIKKLIDLNFPVLATCAGAILLASHIEGENNNHLATFPMTIRRNAYGRQLGSTLLHSKVSDMENFPCVFIRAPAILSVGEDVQIISNDGTYITGAIYGRQIALTYHPELTGDTRIHERFLKIC
jgi:pyridoxal 5'-phosphate synthase pdxT subunit